MEIKFKTQGCKEYKITYLPVGEYHAISIFNAETNIPIVTTELTEPITSLILLKQFGHNDCYDFELHIDKNYAECSFEDCIITEFSLDSQEKNIGVLNILPIVDAIYYSFDKFENIITKIEIKNIFCWFNWSNDIYENFRISRLSINTKNVSVVI